MTTIEMLKAMQEEQDESVLSVYLDIAKDAIIKRLYPFGDGTEEMPDNYRVDQINIAVYLLNKRGAEGQTAHSENGVNRTYASAGVPDALLKGIMPYCGVSKV